MVNFALINEKETLKRIHQTGRLCGLSLIYPWLPRTDRVDNTVSYRDKIHILRLRQESVFNVFKISSSFIILIITFPLRFF
jgi:hypothetical protein